MPSVILHKVVFKDIIMTEKFSILY